jgi:hypothetical protein
LEKIWPIQSAASSEEITREFCSKSLKFRNLWVLERDLTVIWHFLIRRETRSYRSLGHGSEISQLGSKCKIYLT